jgi:hypothetical protein
MRISHCTINILITTLVTNIVLVRRYKKSLKQVCDYCLMYPLNLSLSSVAAVPIVNEKGTEHLVRKAMRNIIMGRSVLYTKTDLSQICNRTAIRHEAVKRLVAADLLQYGHTFWIEPNRSKKEPKKDSKRLLREGWLK